MKNTITRRELIQAQVSLSAAILLQVIVLSVSQDLSFGPQYFLISTEIGMAVLLAVSLHRHTANGRRLQKITAGSLLAFISFANFSSLILVLYSLIVGNDELTGLQLLTSAIAILLTNIIVYALWYWEIDSPGFTVRRWSVHDQDFQFTQQDRPKQFPGWQPEFLDYLYLSATNAVNFAPADSRPLTHPAKMMMASQALLSFFTLALVLARSVSILG